MTVRLVVGVDAGWDGVKIVGPKGEVYFPSVVVPEPPKMMKFSKVLDIKNKFELTMDGRRYLLGEHAQFVTFNQIDLDSHNSTGSKNDESAFKKAIGGICRYLDTFEALEDEDIEVWLVYGSPIISAANDDEVLEIEDMFLNDDEPIEVIYNDIDLNITVRDIFVVPEGVAANFAADFTNLDVVYIVDAGSQNVNLAALRDGIPMAMASDSLVNGVEYFKEMYPDSAASTLAQQVKSRIEKLKWPKGVTIQVAGGYAAELATAFNDLKKNPYTMEVIKPKLLEGKKTREPKAIFANAVGMYNMARGMFGEEAASKRKG